MGVQNRGYILRYFNLCCTVLWILGHGVFSRAEDSSPMTVRKRIITMVWKLWVMFFVIGTILFGILNAYSTAAVSRKEVATIQSAFTEIATMAFYFGMYFLYVVMMWTHGTLVKVVHRLDLFGIKYFRKRSENFFCLVVTLFLASSLAVFFWRVWPVVGSVFIAGVGFEFSGFLWILRDLHLSQPGLFLFLRIVVFLHYLLYLVGLTVVQIMICLVVIGTGLCLYEMECVLRKSVSEKVNLQEVKALLDDHADLCDVVLCLDSILACVNLILYLCYGMNLMAGIPLLTGNNRMFHAAENFGLAVYLLLVTTITQVSVNIQAESVMPMIYKYMRGIDDRKEHYKLMRYVADLQTNRVGLTVGKFFLIDRTFVASLVGVIVTYALVVWELGNKGLSPEDITHLRTVLREESGNCTIIAPFKEMH